jgi:predicted double-glycine peptidase
LAACLVGAAAVVGGAAPAQAQLAGVVTAGNYYSVPVKSYAERRFAGVVKQQFDFSCGSAAVATLLRYHYGQPVTEQDVFNAMYEIGDKDEIKEKGFSLLDIKRYLESQGYDADGFRVPIEKLAESKLPAIMVISTKGYQHFVVVKGMQDGRVLIGDPAMGMTSMSLTAFKASLGTEIIFVIRSSRDVAAKHFNTAKEWDMAPDAPFRDAVSRDALASLTLSMVRSKNEF